MLDELMSKPHRRHIKDLNVVPIIDMLTTVVFFLLLSASFDSFTKLTLPPSGTVSVADPVGPPPRSPKLLMLKKSATSIDLVLSWEGEKPGQVKETVSGSGPERRAQILAVSAKMVKTFLTEFPTETSLQLGLTRDLSYQDLISVMDGSREVMQNLILISYEDAVEASG